ncbi:hypothetical protein LPJ56_000743 [Coemansia sp. RSA 2599]|nr:hypothetical protein LPJ75_000318 [Coemansia sp. RSA 2598]KAJ1828953.1 hypothetical protein LPJ56_000743 [Coemansia sp. RSA 2599]
MEFYDAKGKDVVFANLRNLVLSFQLAKGEERARGPRKKIVSFQLHFPCLRNLTLRDCPEDSELYGCDRYFGDLEKVKVWGSVDSLEAMKALGLKKTSSLDVVIVDDQDDDGKKHDRVYGVAKHYLGTTSSSSKRLFVTANLDYIEYRGIDWSGLSLLALYDTVRFDQVLNFINGIPSLSSFHVLCASFEGVVRDNSEASDGDSSDGDDSTVLERLSPLLPGSMLSLATDNTEVSAGMAIRELSLCFDEEAAYSDRFKARVAGYMIELLPSLQHLYVEPSLQRYLCRKKSEAGAAVYEQPRASIRYADHRALRAYVTDLISQQ